MLQSVLMRMTTCLLNLLSLRELGILVSIVMVLAALVKLLYAPLVAGKGKSPPQLNMPAREVTRAFFEKRFEFIRDGFKITSSSIYQIPLFGRKAIVLSGPEGRRIFTKEKGLNIYDSFSLLMGSSVQFSPHLISGIIKHIASMQRPEHLQSMIPSVLSTCERAMDSWGSETILDPCSSVHEVTFRAIMNIAFCDISEDPALSSQLKSLVDIVDSPANSYTTWCPWLPNMLMFHKIISAARIYRIVQRCIRKRKTSGVKRKDAVQPMIDAGESTSQIFGFILGLSLAGARATGTIVSWLLIRLSTHPEWATTIQKEIQTLTQSGPLSSIPLSSWETLTPQLDLCIRETLRTSQPYTAMRQNNGPEITVGEYTIPSGSLVVYPFADTSLNPAYYPDPERWDPSREVKKEFICWGAGKHGCKGQRLAMLHMKLVAVSILTRFDVSIIGEMGGADYNDSVTCRPQGECGIRVRRR